MKLFDKINQILSIPTEELRTNHLHEMVIHYDQVWELIADYRAKVAYIDQEIDKIEADTTLDGKIEKQSDIIIRANQKLNRYDKETERIIEKNVLDKLESKRKTIDHWFPIARGENRRQASIQ